MEENSQDFFWNLVGSRKEPINEKGVDLRDSIIVSDKWGSFLVI